MGDTLGVVTQVLGHTIVPDLDADRYGLCSMFVKTIIKAVINHHLMIV